FQAEDGIRYFHVTGVQTCALPILTMVVPFLSLYIGSLGEYSEGFIRTWSGWTFAITFVTAFIFSPIWGRLGDKKGRKPILIFVRSEERRVGKECRSSLAPYL